METNIQNTNSVKATATATKNKTASAAMDDMEKAAAKAARLEKIEVAKAARLEKATARLEELKQGARDSVKGFANITLKQTHQVRAINTSVQGAINALNTLIKEVAKAANLNKKIVATLKGEAAQTLLQQVTNETLPLFVDNKGNYKIEALYRLVASKAKNTELRTILNNMNKAQK